MNKIDFYRITAVPNLPINRESVFECIGREDFVVFYDVKNYCSMLGLTKQSIISRLSNQIPGLTFAELKHQPLDGSEDYIAISIYRKNDEDSEVALFGDLFSIIPKEGFMAVLFVNAKMNEVHATKEHIECVLSSKAIRETEHSVKFGSSNKLGYTVQRDLYNESEDKLMLINALDSLNNTILGNGLAYNLFLILPKNSTQLKEYVEEHFLVLAQYEFNKKTINQILDYLSKRSSIPFGSDYLKAFINFYGRFDISHLLLTGTPTEEEGIKIGNFVKNGVIETDSEVKIDQSTINLGFIITGLPGSGKTREMMSIVDTILIGNGINKRIPVFIITPTKEWKDFALFHGMHFIELYHDNTPINFFRCPNSIEIDKFCSNLSMILSSAANAGPYQRPMEKCMFNAFRKIYGADKEPNPIYVYRKIEESIIYYHGKRTNAGIKYTKHGENINSSLENLRGILSKPQYCVKKGVIIEDLAKNGAIFDLSYTSSDTRTQMYALLLNQIYALNERFDTNGDNDLRLVICLDEAQMIFKDPDAPAVEDIKQRIQDFRKQGIGLILLAHNVNDIDVGIRRMCQIKLYLKQAPDTATIASKDLIFPHAEQDDVVLKLKTLQSRIGAFSCISQKETEKIQKDTIFIKTNTYLQKDINDRINPIDKYMRDNNNLKPAKFIQSKLIVRFGEHKMEAESFQESYYVRITLLGEEIATISLNKINESYISLLEGVEYTINILGNTGKIIAEFHRTAANAICLDIKGK
jgi:hypothetical protein